MNETREEGEEFELHDYFVSNHVENAQLYNFEIIIELTSNFTFLTF